MLRNFLAVKFNYYSHNTKLRFKILVLSHVHPDPLNGRDLSLQRTLLHHVFLKLTDSHEERVFPLPIVLAWTLFPYFVVLITQL